MQGIGVLLHVSVTKVETSQARDTLTVLSGRGWLTDLEVALDGRTGRVTKHSLQAGAMQDVLDD